MAEEGKIIDLRAIIHEEDSVSISDIAKPEAQSCITLDSEDYQGENGTERLLQDVLSNLRGGASCVMFTPKGQK